MAELNQQDIEIKETFDKTRFVELLRQWMASIERDRDFEFILDGESYTVPADALEKGRFRVEYEIDEGEHEFELTLKWR